MYELGAARDFCTAIGVSTRSKNQIFSSFVGRNLDYGFQEYLGENSVHFSYVKGGRVLYETVGHAGLVGAHTTLSLEKSEGGFQYALILNERISGGLHLTLW